jgi:DNA polymerase-3 subunit beta
MKITCNKEQLDGALAIVGRTVSQRTPMPILECILLTADDSGLRLMANDLETCIETSPLAADVEESGCVALEARLFTDIVRKMPGETVRIESDAGNVTQCRSGKALFKIMGMPGDEFPAMPEVAETVVYTVPAKELRDMIRQTIFSVASEDTKPILTGELIQYRDGALNIVAVDGFRISYKRVDLPDADAADAASAVVPAKALGELSRVLPDDAGEGVEFFFTDKRAVFSLRGFTFVTWLLEGDFIRYEQIFNEDFTTMVKVGREQFLTGLERAYLIAKESTKSPVKLEIGEKTIVITSNNELGASYDEIPADVDGNTLEIAFNPRYLVEALRALDEDWVVARFTTEHSPCIMRGAENDACKYLILPLRIRA